MTNENNMGKNEIIELVGNHNYKELRHQLEAMHPIDIAELIEELDYKSMMIVYRILPLEEAADTFTNMSSELQEVLINAMTDSEIKEVVDEMYIDETVDVLEEMPANVVDRILMVTDAHSRKYINQLLKYPDRSAGSIMTVEYIGLSKDMSVADAILKIRKVGVNSETIYTCYVTEHRRLIGIVSVKDLLASSDAKTVEAIMETDLIYAGTLDDQEDVAKIIRKYGLMAVPVVDHQMCMVGIVTVDDAMEVQTEENTEDITKMAAVSPSEATYFGTSVYQHVKNRSGWLLILMLSATITGSILGNYENALAFMPVLITFIPMIMGTGGNSGSQSATLIIRGLSVDEIHFEDIFRVIWKEVRVAFLVGVILGVANGVRIYIMNQNLMVAVAVGITLVGTVVLAKFIGCTLPLLAQRIHLDPALMAAPLITTLVDAGSILIYFQVAIRIFHIA